MDRNEVILVGRLPEAAHIRSLQSGSRLCTWRLIVRRQHRGSGARVDTIPCASFELEVIEAVAGWLPDDIVEVTGSLRRRWWGSEGAKSSGYEVEVRSVRRLERKVTMILTGDEEVPAPAPPRSVRSLVHAGQGDTGQGVGPRLTSVKPDLTSSRPSLAPAGPDVTAVGGADPTPGGPDLIGLDSVPVGPGLVPVGRDSAPVGPDLISVERDLASAGPDHLTLVRPDLAPEPKPEPGTVEASMPGRPQVPRPVTRAGAVSGAGK
ncbi:single-stranded DNA-binding protein [Streptosporangium sp. G12]